MRMQKDNHFVEIRPRGSQRQYTLEERQILADDMSCATVEQADAINDARIAFAAQPTQRGISGTGAQGGFHQQL